MGFKNYSMYRILSILMSKGIHISDILQCAGINRFHLYGIGEMGHIILDDCRDTNMIISAYDRSVVPGQMRILEEYSNIAVYNPSDILNDDITIVVSPSSDIRNIIRNLMQHGVDGRRIVTFNFLLFIGYHLYVKRDISNYSFENDQFLIVGANFDNKGSQAMTFVAINEIKKRFPNSQIWFCPNFWDDIYDKEHYCFLTIKDSHDDESMLYELAPFLKAVFDVSGFALSSTIGDSGTKRIMNYIKIAYDYDVPYFILPQSIGPFDYPKYEIAQMQELLSYCSLIFVREEKGYKQIAEKFALQNVIYSNDMVLQTNGIEDLNVYTLPKQRVVLDLDGSHGVAVVPNSNLILYKGKHEIADLYAQIIESILLLGERVIIIPHSNDHVLCCDIYKRFQSDCRVSLLEREMDCIDFTKIISTFRYVIASRYHAVVHSYKEGIPCIIVGWADKYTELADKFDQGQYLFDIRNNININDVRDVIGIMSKEYAKESKKILKVVATIQEESCFDRVWDKFAEVNKLHINAR